MGSIMKIRKELPMDGCSRIVTNITSGCNLMDVIFYFKVKLS